MLISGALSPLSKLSPFLLCPQDSSHLHLPDLVPQFSEAVTICLL